MRTHLLGIIAAMPSGKVFFAADIAAQMGETVNNVSHVLSEIAREGMVVHLTKGIYCKPLKTAQGVVLPVDRDRVIAAVLRHYAVEAVPKGLSAAWALGLLAERPETEQYVVEHGEHRFDFGDWRLELLRGRIRPFLYRTQLAALLVTALPSLDADRLSAEQAALLKKQIIDCPDREAFRDDVVRMPLWIKKYLRRL